MKSFDKILVPVDFSDASFHALQRALAIADALGGHVDVLHVGVEPSSYAPLDRALFGKDHAQLSRLAKDATDQQLAEFMARLPEAERQRVDSRLAYGHAVETIVRVAREGGYDLVVVGTHGRTGAQHVLMGSVAERVVRMAPCAVLAVR